jgi:cytochrome c oxidase cbb3-type subunit 3
MRSLVAAAALTASLLAWAAFAAAPVRSSNPLSGDPQAIEAGKHLFIKYCAQCHGDTGDGISPRWGKMGADLRKFFRGYSEFVITVVEGRPKKRMPPWGSVLDAEQIAQIGAYVETLSLPGAKWED